MDNVKKVAEDSLEVKGMDHRMNISGSVIEPLSLNRYFTKHGKSPFELDIYGNPINWVSEDVNITDDSGKTIYIQPGVRKPSFWSTLALKVVASKYFNEEQARILKEEVAAICLNQLAVFNSPVWFNVGIQQYSPIAGGVSPYKWESDKGMAVEALKNEDRPQCSACFILGMKDDMEHIMEVQKAEAFIFKGGSGAGSNRSALRSSKERLTGGGVSSGPVTFMKGYDAYAGAIKSGGKTRRAAKME